MLYSFTNTENESRNRTKSVLTLCEEWANGRLRVYPSEPTTFESAKFGLAAKLDSNGYTLSDSRVFAVSDELSLIAIHLAETPS